MSTTHYLTQEHLQELLRSERERHAAQLRHTIRSCAMCGTCAPLNLTPETVQTVQNSPGDAKPDALVGMAHDDLLALNTLKGEVKK